MYFERDIIWVTINCETVRSCTDLLELGFVCVCVFGSHTIENVFIQILKGCLGWGSHTSILTPYLKSTGLFTPGVKFSSNSVQPLQRYYNIQAHCNVGTENLNLGNPSVLMT